MSLRDVMDDVSRVRNFALAGHRSGGKTTLGDLLLEVTGVTRAMGSVDEGTSLLDHEPEERRRNLSLSPSFAWMEWGGSHFEMVDTPGCDGFLHDQNLAIGTADGVVVVVDAAGGPQAGGERVIGEARRCGLPLILFVNRLDRVGDVDRTLAALDRLAGESDGPSVKFVPVQWPVFDDRRRFTGVVSLLENACESGWMRFVPDRTSRFSKEEIPEAWREAVESARERLVETVATSNDALLEAYLEDLELPLEMLLPALARAMAQGQIVPVFFGAAGLGMGAQPLLDGVARLFPSPDQRRAVWAMDGEGQDESVPVGLREGAPFVAQHVATRLDEKQENCHVLRVWSGLPPRGPWLNGESGATRKVQKLYSLRGSRAATVRYAGPGAFIATWEPLGSRPGETWTDGVRWVIGGPAVPAPMVSWMLHPVAPRDSQRLPEALSRIAQLDPALEIAPDGLTGKPVLGGVSQEHMERAIEWLRGRFGVNVDPVLPPVAYREAPLAAVHGITGEHRRASDGRNEFGQCVVNLLPIEPEAGLVVRFMVDESDLPDKFLGAVEAGFHRGLRAGPLAGYPVLGVEIACIGGQYDILDSTEEHLFLAGERAMLSALAAAGTQLLEPWGNVAIVVPADEVGLVLGEVASRRGRVHGMEIQGREATVHADCPLRELQTFAPRLSSLTSARGRFTVRPGRYESLPPSLVKDTLASSPFRAGEEVLHRKK